MTDGTYHENTEVSRVGRSKLRHKKICIKFPASLESRGVFGGVNSAAE